MPMTRGHIASVPWPAPTIITGVAESGHGSRYYLLYYGAEPVLEFSSRPRLDTLALRFAETCSGRCSVFFQRSSIIMEGTVCGSDDKSSAFWAVGVSRISDQPIVRL